MRNGARDIDDALASIVDARHGLRQAFPTMVMGVILAVGVAQLIVRAQAPRFSATATLLVRPPADPRMQPGRAQLTSGPSSENSEMENQVAVLRSERLVRDVHAALFADRSAAHEPPRLDDFAAGLTVRRIGLSNVLSVTYMSGDPGEAARFANAITAGYLKQRVDEALADVSASRITSRLQAIQHQAEIAAQAIREGRSPMEVLGDADALVLDTALPPTEAVAPQRKASLVFAAILGIALPAWVAIIRAVVNPTIRTSSDIVRLLGVPCLGELTARPDGTTIEGQRTVLALVTRRLRSIGRKGKVGLVLTGPRWLRDVIEALTTLPAQDDVDLITMRQPSGEQAREPDVETIVLSIEANRARAVTARRDLTAWRQAGWPVAGAILVTGQQRRSKPRFSPLRWLSIRRA